MADKDRKGNNEVRLYGGGGQIRHVGDVHGSFRDCPDTTLEMMEGIVRRYLYYIRRILKNEL
jgi:hypothetical protein